MVQGTEPAHKLLELLIVKALVSGKARGSTVRLRSDDLAASFETKAAGELVDLVINIDLSWDEPTDIIEEILGAEDEKAGRLS
jgi:hypothetical protein